jgi:hypothetical protein
MKKFRCHFEKLRRSSRDSSSADFICAIDISSPKVIASDGDRFVQL